MHCMSDSLRNELQPLLVALARGIERAHRQNQLDHRAPVLKQSPIRRLWHFERAVATLWFWTIEFVAALVKA